MVSIYPALRFFRTPLTALGLTTVLLVWLAALPGLLQGQTVSGPAGEADKGRRPDTAQADRLPPLPEDPRLRLIESLYRTRDAYRAESEILRLLRFTPDHPQRPQVELARAKLYYRDGRYQEAGLMVYSILDRHAGSPVALPALKLLGFNQVRQGRLKEAEATFRQLTSYQNPDPPSPLLALSGAPPGVVDADSAAAWSTWLPGSGYFKLDRPGKAVTAMGLNLMLLGGAAYYAREERTAPALLFLLLEMMFWQGGRQGVRQDAEAINRRLQMDRVKVWLIRQGEPALLQIGIQTTFGG